MADLIVERTDEPIYVCNVTGRVDAVEYRARVGATEILRFWTDRPAAIEAHLPELARVIASLCYLPMR
jgi:hypothetical protein